MSKGRERSLQMLSTALEMERKGRAFYEEAVSTCRNEFGREMFRMLMKEEAIHMDRIIKIHESLKAGKAWSEEWKSIEPDHKKLEILLKEMTAAHGSKITATTSDLEALDVGIDFELQSIAFYQENLAKAGDALEQEFLEHMIVEEKSHHKALSDTKLYLSDPAAWFVEQEHPGLDGA